MTIIDPHIKRDPSYYIYQEAEQGHYFVKNKDGADYDGCCPQRRLIALTWQRYCCMHWVAQQCGWCLAQVVLARLFAISGHAEPQCAAVVGAAVFPVQVQGLHAKPVRLERHE